VDHSVHTKSEITINNNLTQNPLNNIQCKCITWSTPPAYFRKKGYEQFCSILWVCFR